MPKLRNETEIPSVLSMHPFFLSLLAYKMASVPTSAAPVLGHFLGPWSCLSYWSVGGRLAVSRSDAL